MDLKSVLLLPDHYDIGKDMLESMDKICRDLFASDFEYKRVKSFTCISTYADIIYHNGLSQLAQTH